MIAVVAALVALACFSASARRLWFVLSATSFDLDRLVEELRGKAGARRVVSVRSALLEVEGWERDVLQAVGEADAIRRTAGLNEQLTELDFQLLRWSRVPRVCASLSSSVGFLLAALLLRQGLADPSALSGDVSELVTSGLVGQALAVVGFGLAGAVGCAALQARGNRAAKEVSVAADAFIARLETLEERERAARGAGTDEAAETGEGAGVDEQDGDAPDVPSVARG